MRRHRRFYATDCIRIDQSNYVIAVLYWCFRHRKKYNCISGNLKACERRAFQTLFCDCTGPVYDADAKGAVPFIRALRYSECRGIELWTLKPPDI